LVFHSFLPFFMGLFPRKGMWFALKIKKLSSVSVTGKGTKACFRGTTLFFAKEQTLLRPVTVPAVAA